MCFNLFGFTLQILSARQSACPLRLEFPAACPWCLGCSNFFACSKDGTLSIHKMGNPCNVLQELPVSVSICLGFTLQILPAWQSTCPFRPEFPAACPWCLGCSDFFACSKDNMLSIHKTGSPCERLQELPIFVSICLRFTLRILSARQSTCPLRLEFPAACPRSHIPWSQRLFSPAPKTARRTWSVPKCFP